ncbi:MAG TPA: RluA family pseudouridine synthase [Planctomycetes bacterium]|nr:RluA family pseudouridine synthase [Planctomycetota bacterium]
MTPVSASLPENSNHQPAYENDFDADADLLSTQGDERVGEHLCFRVGSSIKSRRLDRYLGGRFSQFSRTRLQKIIKDQGVNVNGRPAKPSHKLNPGDEIDLILPPRELRELVAEDIPISVIYEDDQMIVVNKQADLIVHPARGNTHGTLVNGLVYYADKLSTGSGEFRPGIVHRLDKNTTGVLVVAKTDTAHWKLARQFAQRKTNKTYLAVVHGRLELNADCINKPVGMHPIARQKGAIRPDGKEAVTFYEVLEEFRGFSLVKLSPKTGRTHQLRIHMAYLQHPIVADDMYGGKVVYDWQLQDRDAEAAQPVINRPALHAARLEIRHPVSGEMMEFQAPLPPDMQTLIDKLRKFRSL